jgi:parallel beta-helix repeat protein
VRLVWNGTPVSPDLAQSGGLTTIQYAPLGLLAPGTANSYQLTFSDTARPATTTSLTFGFAVVQYVGPNGNFYEVVNSPGIGWAEAKLAAEQRTYCGRQGHLATISDRGEDVYLEELRQADFVGGVWVGGFQNPDQLAPNEGWFWVHAEGPISGSNTGPTFADWSLGEPNDWGMTTDIEDGEEDYLAIGQVGLGWNDQSSSATSGYIVEYEMPVLAIDIKPGDSSNVVNLDSKGKIPVAILSTPSFDAASIDPATIRFGRSGTEAAPANCALSDVIGDRLKDLVCHFYTQETGFLWGDTVVWLRAAPYGCCPMKGSDAIVLKQAQAIGKTIKIDHCPFTITAPGSYCLTHNLGCQGTAIKILASEVDLDLGGRTITGNGTGEGILVEWQENVHIHDGTVQGFETGVAFGATLDNTIDHLNAKQNTWFGLAGRGGSTGLTMTDNTATDNGGGGILFDSGSHGNTLAYNTANHNGYVGIAIGNGAFGNSVTHNSANRNGANGIALEWDTYDNVVTDNTANQNGDRGRQLDGRQRQYLRAEHD